MANSVYEEGTLRGKTQALSIQLSNKVPLSQRGIQGDFLFVPRDSDCYNEARNM